MYTVSEAYLRVFFKTLRGGVNIGKSEFNHFEDFSILLNISRGANSRKRILKTLLIGPKNCMQIAKHVNLNWHTTSRHIQILKKEGLVNVVSLGERKFFKLTLKGQEVLESYKGDNSQ
jgi:predicted transcriptional regulator